MTDPIADMLTRIRNAVLVNKNEVLIPFSKMKFELGKILAQEGFIKGVEKTDEDSIKSGIKIVLKYHGKEPVINGIKRVSRSGQRVYHGHKDIKKILPSLGVQLVSTSQGIMTNKEAKLKKVGGEILCEIY